MKTKGEKVYTSFELKAPSAEEVMVCGDFTEWESKARRLRRLKSGLWKATLKLPRGDHQYRLKWMVCGLMIRVAQGKLIMV